MTTTAEQARQELAGHSIWIWHYLHADWQWEQSRAWHEDRYALAVEEVLDLMREDPELTYFFDTASEFFEPVARKLGPRMDELKERVAEGRIKIVSAQVANPRPNQVGEETYIRNLQLGRAFFQENLPPTDLSLFHSVDIAIGHSQMPQLLRQAGFESYRAWRPHGPMNALGIPHQFVWEGIDGSRIPVTRGQYGGFFFKEHVVDGYVDDWDDAVSTLFDTALRDQLLHDRSPSRQLWLTMGHDDARPYRIWQGDQAINLRGFIAEWRTREEPPITWCTPIEYHRAVLDNGDLPVVKGVLDGADCSYNAANGGAHGLWTWRLFNDRRLLQAERWAALAETVGNASAQEELRGLWRQHLTYQAHAEEFAFEDDLTDLIDLGRDVKLRAERIEATALGAIARAAGGGDRFVQYVFNPHPWPVTTDLEIYHPCAIAGIESLQVVDEDGNALPQQVLVDFRHPRYSGSVNDQRLLARVELPPLGYTRLHIVEHTEPMQARPDAPVDGIVQTEYLRLAYRDDALREIQDTSSGTTYQAAGGAAWPALTWHGLDNQNWLFTGDETGRETFAAERGEWLQTGPLRWRHRAHGTVGPYQAQVDTITSDRGREIEVRVRLEGHWGKQPERTGFVTLMSEVGTGGVLTVDVPFGVETRDPDNDIYRNNVPTDRDLGVDTMFERLRPGFFWARSWSDWSGDGHGVSVIGANGNFYWQKEAERFGPVLVRAITLVPNSWEEFCAPAMTGAGIHEFTYVIRFHDGDWRTADPQRRAAELHLPPRAVRPDHPSAAELPATHAFLEITGPAILSALYREGDAQIVRLYEHEGTGGNATLTFDRPIGTAKAIDLTGRPVDAPIEVNENTVRTNVRPWQIMTLRVR